MNVAYRPSPWMVVRGCLRKRRYETRAKAWKAVKRTGGGHGRPYACTYGCNGWHLGHS